jgi:hypothetical protein
MLNAVQKDLSPIVVWPRSDGGIAPMQAKSVYFALMNERGGSDERLDEAARTASRAFLHRQLEEAATLSSDLPANVHSLAQWIQSCTEEVARQYRKYLDARKAGGARRYFTNKSHALYFLKSVAPTKLVDGAWLYGLLQRWNDARFASLIRIYLEELGEGVPSKNHVVLYRKLLATHGCDQWTNLDDAHFVQGGIQLSLAHHAADFLPEVIGFNLGYEQLPLHLLITAYELNELGIDPYYFTLHVTVDNAVTGHARSALQGVLDALPRVGDTQAFYQRLANGYKLNMLGASTLSVIDSFNLDEELMSVFAAKAAVGSGLHSDYCRVAGRTVNDWLAEPGQLPAFLASLEQAGWIKRHQDPQNSRFWKLIHGERAEMFGVFNDYEQQLIYDWISGHATEDEGSAQASAGRLRPRTFRAQQRMLDTLGERAHERGDRQHGSMTRGLFREHFSGLRAHDGKDNFNTELRLLEEKLAALSSKEEAMTMLIPLMSPANHHTAPGLMATRIFTRLFR